MFAVMIRESHVLNGGNGLKKRIVFIVALALLTCLGMSAAAMAETKMIVLKVGDPNMTVNGVSQEIDPARGTAPIIVAGRTLVPIRTIVEQMNGTIAWSGDEQLVTITAAKKTIKIWIGNKTAQVRDSSVADVWSGKALDVPAKSINGRTMVPLRFVTENLGATVSYNNGTITLSFTPVAFDALNWSGTWTQDSEPITLIQSGINVSGSNGYWGTLKGTASGKVLTGTWYKNVTDQGDIEFTMSDDGKSFTGKWRYDFPGLDEESKDWHTGEVGTR
jgi:hypothetical protein